MLNISGAYIYAFYEVRKRPIFWIFIALLYVVLGNIRDAFPQDLILKGTVAFSESLLFIGVANVALNAINNKDYELTDIILEPIVYLKIFILSMIIILIGCLLFLIPTFIGFISLYFANSAFSFLINLPNLILILLLSVFIFTKCFFAQYYLLDKKVTIEQSLKESWKDSTYKVTLSMLLSILFLVALSFPLLTLDMTVRSIHLRSVYFLVPVLQLSGAHLYMQVQNRKAKGSVEQEKIAQKDSGTCEG